MSDDSKEDLDATLELCVDITPKDSDETSPEVYSNHDSKEEITPTTTPRPYPKDGRDASQVLQLTQPFFVSESMDDDVSLIIPPTPADETVPFIIPGTPPEAAQETTSIVDESVMSIDGNQQGLKKQLLFVDEDDDDWSKPTQPVYPVKQDAEPHVIAASDDEDDATYVESESILGSCYDLPTQRCLPLPKDPTQPQPSNPAGGGSGDDDWNLHLTASQATQNIEATALEDKEKLEDFDATVRLEPETKLSVESSDKEESLLAEETVRIADGEKDVVILEKEKAVEEEEKASSPSNALSEKEGTPEEVRLFAAIESIVNAARAENKSGPVLPEAGEQKPDAIDSDSDEIEPSQTSSRSVDISREAVRAASNGVGTVLHVPDTEVDSCRMNNVDTETTEIAETGLFIKDSETKDGKSTKPKLVLMKKTNRLAKNSSKKLQEALKKKSDGEVSSIEDAQPNFGGVSDSAGTTPSFPEIAAAVTSSSSTKQGYQTPPKRKPSDSPKKKEDVEMPSVEDTQQISGGAVETVEKTPPHLLSSGSEVLGPPLSPLKQTYRTPQKKKAAKWGISAKGDRNMTNMEPPLDLRFNIRSHHKRLLGSFTDSKSLEKVLQSLGIFLEEEKLKNLCSPYRRFAEHDVLKRKAVHRVFVKENEIFEELQPIEEVHGRIEISPINSSSTTTSTKTSSFVSTSGEMGDISSSISSKSLSSSASSAQPDARNSQDMSAPFKSPSQTSDAIPFPAHLPKPVLEPTSFSDKMLSQDDFKNPVVMISPLKPTKRSNSKKGKGSSLDKPKTKKMRTRKPSVKKVGTTSSEDSDGNRVKKGEVDDEVQFIDPSTLPKSSKKPSSSKKGRADTRRRGARKNVPEKTESTNGVEVKEEIVVPAFDEDFVEDANNDPSPFGNILPGIRVMARWKDGFYYPGIVMREEVDGRWEVQFDDGAIRIVIQDNLLKIPVLQVGTRVLALSPDGYYDPGIVSSHYREGKDTGYEIEQQNGIIRRYPRASVILSTEQAKLIITKRPMAPSSLTINLDNIVGGKRKRKSSTHQPETSNTPPPKTRPSRRRNPDPNLDSTASSAGESAVPPVTIALESPDEDEVPIAKRQKQARAKASKSKRGQKSKAKAAPQPDGTSVDLSSSDVPELEKKSAVAKRATTRQDAGLVRSSKLFKDFAFLLTYANRKSPDDDEDEKITFDKEHLHQLIESGGGIVYETFEEAQKCSKRKVILLANSHLRTIKYLQCVAANIPCIQHYWIQNCALTRTVVEWGTYVLQTGVSLLHSSPIQWHSKTNIFKGLKIVITADKKQGQDFVNLWTPVLLAAKAELVQKWNLPSFSLPGTPFIVDVIVTNETCPANITAAAKRGRIPLVSSEYIIQCIIVGSQLPYDAHPKFKYDFKA